MDRKSRSYRGLVLWACLLLIRPVLADDLLLLPSGEGGIYARFIEQFLARPEVQGLDTRILPTVSQQSFPPDVVEDPHGLLLTIGTVALHFALSHPSSQPILAVMVTKDAFLEHLRHHPGAEQRLASGKLGAIYLQQPLARQVALARVVAPQASRLGTVLGPATRGLEPRLRAISADFHFQLVAAKLDKNDNPGRVIDHIIASSDIYLALPDSSLFNQGTARWVLYSALKRRHPVLAFSARYVTAGAIAAVYTSVSDAAIESAETVGHWLEQVGKPLPAPHMPHRYSISTNPDAADSLDIMLPSIPRIREGIEALMREVK